MAEEKCVSCLESSGAPVVTHCVECGGGLCAGHIFECSNCEQPMCHPCWVKNGKEFCSDCSPQV